MQRMHKNQCVCADRTGGHPHGISCLMAVVSKAAQRMGVSNRAGPKDMYVAVASAQTAILVSLNPSHARRRTGLGLDSYAPHCPAYVVRGLRCMKPSTVRTQRESGGGALALRTGYPQNSSQWNALQASYGVQDTAS